MVVLQPVTTSVLASLPAEGGRLVFDTTTKTLKYNDGIVDHELTTAVLDGPVGINTSNPDRTLEISDTNGDVLRLTHNDTDGNAVNYIDFKVTDEGDLVIDASGNTVSVGPEDDLNIPAHDGNTKGLRLAGQLVTTTATQLNYNDVAVAGEAEGGKALVLSSGRDIININALTASTLTGTLITPAQPNVTSLGVLEGLVVNQILNVADHNGLDTGLKLNEVLVTATADELNYLDGSTPGTAVLGKALVVDNARDINNINFLYAVELTGTLKTPAQPNVTSVGTLQGLNVQTTTNLLFSDAAGDATKYPLTVASQTTSTPANGLGVGIKFQVENSENVDTVFGHVNIKASDVTAGSETGKYSLNLMNGGTMVNDIMTVDHTGEIKCTRLFETSDRRIKEDIKEADAKESLDKVMQIQIKDYRYSADPEVLHRGVIAQELKEVIPQAVLVGEKNGISDFHTISNSEMLSYLIHAVQEVNRKVESMATV